MNPIVVKLGGEVVRAHASPTDALPVLCGDLAALARSGQPVIVVHGGGPQATELKRLGLSPHIVAGRRVTDRDTLDVMKMAVAGLVNVDLCSALLAAGARPSASTGRARARSRRTGVLRASSPAEDPIRSTSASSGTSTG